MTLVDTRQQVDLIQLSDLHLSDDATATLGGVNAKANFIATLAYLQRHFVVEKLVLTGDLSHDNSPQTLAWLVAQLARYQLQEDCHWLLGNHDEPEQTAQALALLQAAKQWSQNGWQVMLLNTHSGEPHGWLARGELERLERVAELGEPVLVMQHHHPHPIGAFIDRHGLRNASDLGAVVARYRNIKVLAHGHVHQELSSSWHDLQVLACPATSVQFGRTAEFSMTEDKPGFRWFKLSANGHLDTAVVRVPSGAGADPEQLHY